MRRVYAGTLVAMLTACMVFVPAKPAKAAGTCNESPLGLICLNVENGQAVVTGPGISMSAPVPVEIREVPIEVPVPGPTVEVPIPGPTVTLPRETVTVPGSTVPLPRETVTVPGPTATVTETAPGRTAPGATTTVTETQTNTETVTQPRRTEAPGQKASPSATMAQETKTVETTRFIRVTVPQLVTFSLLAILLGAFVVLLVLYIMYRLGREEGEASLDGFLEELRDLTLVRKR